jgi:hypothetical protein
MNKEKHSFCQSCYKYNKWNFYTSNTKTQSYGISEYLPEFCKGDGRGI